MLVAPDVESVESWNVIASTSGYDQMTRSEALQDFSSLLREAVRKSQWPKIARATVLKTTDPFVKAMNLAFDAKEKPVNITSCNVFGVDIPKGMLFYSQKLAA